MQYEVKEYINANLGMFYKVKKSIAKQQSPYQLIELVETDAFGKVLLIDGITQVSELWEERYHETLVHPAMLAHKAPKKVLLIGGGDGGALREILKHKTVETIDFVELDETVIAFSKLHLEHIHKGSFYNAKVNIHIGDGRAFVENSKAKYDVVIMDMTDPRGPARFLYTSEFFGFIKKLIGQEGIFSMHGESPMARPVAYGSIEKTLLDNFAHVSTALTFVPMYSTLWAFCYAADSLEPKKLTQEDVHKNMQRLSSNTLFIKPEIWPSLFCDTAALDAARTNDKACIMLDQAPDFYDDF